MRRICSSSMHNKVECKRNTNTHTCSCSQRHNRFYDVTRNQYAHTHTHTHGTESSRFHTAIRTSLDDNGLHRTTTRTASEPPARFSLFDAMTAFAAFSIFHTRSFAFPPRARRFPHHTRKPEYTLLASNRRLNLGRVFCEYEFSSRPKRSPHLTAPPSPTDNAAMPLSMPSSLFRPCTELVDFLWLWASRGLAVLE